MKTNNDTINQFIIDTVLVSPVNDILNKLQERSFRDCDIKWLDNKLESFTKFACETLSINAEGGLQRESFTHFNEYVTERYTFYFSTLLNYFKSV